MNHISLDKLNESLPQVKLSPQDAGRLDLIVRRANVDERETIASGELDVNLGLVGDNWKARGSNKSADGSALPDAQITLMNSRLIDAIAQSRERWAMAGDQLYVDLDLSEENLPPGTRLAIGAAVLEITARPHTGCNKFSERFGADALKFISTAEGRSLRLRGVYARVVQPGGIKTGEPVRKV